MGAGESRKIVNEGIGKIIKVNVLIIGNVYINHFSFGLMLYPLIEWFLWLIWAVLLASMFYGFVTGVLNDLGLKHNRLKKFCTHKYEVPASFLITIDMVK